MEVRKASDRCIDVSDSYVEIEDSYFDSCFVESNGKLGVYNARDGLVRFNHHTYGSYDNVKNLPKETQERLLYNKNIIHYYDMPEILDRSLKKGDLISECVIHLPNILLGDIIMVKGYPGIVRISNKELRVMFNIHYLEM